MSICSTYQIFFKYLRYDYSLLKKTAKLDVPKSGGFFSRLLKFRILFIWKVCCCREGGVTSGMTVTFDISVFHTKYSLLRIYTWPLESETRLLGGSRVTDETIHSPQQPCRAELPSFLFFFSSFSFFLFLFSPLFLFRLPIRSILPLHIENSAPVFLWKKKEIEEGKTNPKQDETHFKSCWSMIAKMAFFNAV